MRWRENYGQGRRFYSGRFDVYLDEAEYIDLFAWTKNVVGYCGSNCRWLFVRDSLGKLIWRRMPPEYLAAVEPFEKVIREERELRQRQDEASARDRALREGRGDEWAVRRTEPS